MMYSFFSGMAAEKRKAEGKTNPKKKAKAKAKAQVKLETPTEPKIHPVGPGGWDDEDDEKMGSPSSAGATEE